MRNFFFNLIRFVRLFFLLKTTSRFRLKHIMIDHLMNHTFTPEQREFLKLRTNLRLAGFQLAFEYSYKIIFVSF